MVSEVSTGAIPATIVSAAAGGDAMAFAQIVRAHHDDMARVCRVVCGDPELAQDAAQAAWPIAWRKLGTVASFSRPLRAVLAPDAPTRGEGHVAGKGRSHPREGLVVAPRSGFR